MNESAVAKKKSNKSNDVRASHTNAVKSSCKHWNAMVHYTIIKYTGYTVFSKVHSTPAIVGPSCFFRTNAQRSNNWNAVLSIKGNVKLNQNNEPRWFWGCVSTSHSNVIDTPYCTFQILQYPLSVKRHNIYSDLDYLFHVSILHCIFHLRWSLT